MQLKDFVKETIVQLAKGIEEANAELSSCDALVNPRHVDTSAKIRQNEKVYGFLDRL